MTRGESERRWFSLVVNLAAFFGALQATASNLDATEWRAFAFAATVACIVEAGVRLALLLALRSKAAEIDRRGRARLESISPCALAALVFMWAWIPPRPVSFISAGSRAEFQRMFEDAQWTR